MMPRVIVVGSHGFLGRHVVEAFTKSAIDVVSASRRGPTRIDLCDAATFAVVRPGDIVVNCADSTQASSYELARHCLELGADLVEPAHHVTRTAELLRLRRDSACQGRVLIGLGIFPGVLNLLGCAAAEQAQADAVELWLRVGVFSGAGRCMCRHMVEHLSAPALQLIDGRIVESPPTGARSMLGRRPWRALSVDFPEPLMFEGRLRTARVFLGLRPEILTASLPILGYCTRWVPGLSLPLRWGVTALRAGLLQRAPASIEMSAIASGHSQAVELRLKSSDGIRCAAAAIVHGVARLTDGYLTPGVYLPEDLGTLDELLAALPENLLRVEDSPTMSQPPLAPSVHR